MVFTPSPDTNGRLRTNWDNWGHYTNGTWYLYYIVGRECPGRWVAYGYATSENGVQWVDHGDMLYPLTEPGVRQSCSNSDYALGSGWVWRSPMSGKWLVNWSQSNSKAGRGQSIFFAEADTPVGPWRNITAERPHASQSVAPLPPFRPDTRWYTSTSGMGRWDTETPPTSCSIVRKWGCFRELDCGANVTRRCVGGAMLSGSITTQEACACACSAQRKGYTMGGLEEDRCFCAHDNAPPSTKCGAANASTTCPNGVGGDCSVEVFSFSCTTTASSPPVTTAATPSEFSAPVVCPSPPPPPPPPPPQQPIRPGFALCETKDGYNWNALPSPVINFNPAPANPNVEASGARPIKGPDGVTRWYALVGAAAWTSIGGRMGMFSYVSQNMTGPYETQTNYAMMAYQQGWVCPAYFATFFPTEEHGLLLNHQVVAPGGGTESADYVAPLKAVVIDMDGTLRLAYWKGNDVLKGIPLKSVAPDLVQLNGSDGFVAEGTVSVEAGGTLSFAACGGASGGDVSISVAGNTLAMQILAGSTVKENIDRALSNETIQFDQQERVQGGGTETVVNFTAVQRKGMWEFYLGGILALPERLPAAWPCIDLAASGGLVIEKAWTMPAMPANTPVPPAPTDPKDGDAASAATRDVVEATGRCFNFNCLLVIKVRANCSRASAISGRTHTCRT
eukprot:gene17661-24300_t